MKTIEDFLNTEAKSECVDHAESTIQANKANVLMQQASSCPFETAKKKTRLSRSESSLQATQVKTPKRQASFCPLETVKKTHLPLIPDL